MGSYFRPGYIASQAIQGSLICRAIKVHGLEAFSLSVLSLGPSLEFLSRSADVTPDYIELEQFFLSYYVLALNLNRFATPAAYVPSSNLINQGTTNPSSGLVGPKAFA